MAGNNQSAVNKKWYKHVFKQIQPIHIGAGSYGVINETRIFISGWTMWGALTKAYNLKKGVSLSENQKLFEHISCFYPCFDEEGRNVLFPKFENGEFVLGNYSEDNFRAKFVDTFISTAIDSKTNTALDESLHEINVILPGAKVDLYEGNVKEKQLYWVGVVQLKDKQENDLPSEIYVGGEVKYGLGKMECINKNYSMEILSGEWKAQDRILKNYLPVKRKESYFSGKVELLVEIDNAWERERLQVKLRDGNGFFYLPGTKVNKLSDWDNGIKKGIYY